MTGPKFFRLVRIRNLLKGWMTKVWSGLSHDLAFCYFFHGGRSMFWICCCCTVKGFGTWCTATTEAISRAYTAFWTWSSPTVGPYTTTLSTTFVLLSVPCRWSRVVVTTQKWIEKNLLTANKNYHMIRKKYKASDVLFVNGKLTWIYWKCQII